VFILETNTCSQAIIKEFFPKGIPVGIIRNSHWNNGSFQKRSILPPRRKFLPSGGGGEKKVFLIIVN
jgi:hypothetical protein